MCLKNKFLSAWFTIIVSLTSGMAQPISPDFDYTSRYMEVMDSKMHYIDEYQNEADSRQLTFLFLHGNPTSSYLWRNIIPYSEPYGRVIAVDLIGMGKSDKPDIDYTFSDHSKFLDGFIEKLDLHNIILVIHDWGSALGFYYAHRHPEKIKGIVFMEAIYKTTTWKDMKFIPKIIFKKLRDPVKGPKMAGEKNFFLKKGLPFGTKRKLSKKEIAYYSVPYPTIKSRKPLIVWPTQIPIDEKPADVHLIVTEYAIWLKTTNIPKLLLYAKPGMIIRKDKVEEIRNSFINTSLVYIGKGKHFIQEDQPHQIGKAIQMWVKDNFNKK